MAPTIGRQWRGGPQDYAALCDYCDVRYFRSQLRKQSTGRLACVGPGTNSCGAGLDEVSLDKINADKMRYRRKPTKNAGGRFDRLRTSLEEIFSIALIEYWDARVGVESSSDGALVSWKGQRLGATYRAVSGGGGAGRWWSSREVFYGRPAIEITSTEFDTGLAPLLVSGARPYIGAVCAPLSSVLFLRDLKPKAALIGDSGGGGAYAAQYMSVADPAGTIVPMTVLEVGNANVGRLYELDATEVFTFRAGSFERASAVDSPTEGLWNRATLQWPCMITLLVLCDRPSRSQIAEFRSLASSYAVMRP